MKTHGQVLREFRQKKGWSPAEMAKKLDVAESTLRSYENGHREIKAETAIKFEERLERELTRFHIRPDLFEQQAAA